MAQTARTAQVINLNKFSITVDSLREVRRLRKELVDKPESEKLPTDLEAIAALDTCIAELGQIIAEPLTAV